MTQINLLPWREQARKKHQARFGIIIALVAGAGLFCTVFFHLYYTSKINHQLKRNAILQTSLDEESAALMILNTKKKEVENIDDQLHFVYSLRDSSYRAVRLLNELTIINPETITLYKIIRNGNAITVYGKAKSNLQITLFMESIDKSKFFTQPDLTEISGKEGTEGEERIFQLKIVQE